jgi:hypothetical protein
MVMHITEKSNLGLKSAMVISISVSVILLAVKFVAYILTVPPPFSPMPPNPLFNVIASIFAFLSLRIAMKPPDEKHTLTAMARQSSFRRPSKVRDHRCAIWITYKAVHELVTGPEFHKLDVGIGSSLCL